MTGQRLDIPEIRRQLALSQQELADSLRVNKRTVSRWETGRSRPHQLYVEHLTGMWRERWLRKRLPVLGEDLT